MDMYGVPANSRHGQVFRRDVIAKLMEYLRTATYEVFVKLKAHESVLPKAPIRSPSPQMFICIDRNAYLRLYE